MHTLGDWPPKQAQRLNALLSVGLPEMPPLLVATFCHKSQPRAILTWPWSRTRRRRRCRPLDDRRHVGRWSRTLVSIQAVQGYEPRVAAVPRAWGDRPDSHRLIPGSQPGASSALASVTVAPAGVEPRAPRMSGGRSAVELRDVGTHARTRTWGPGVSGALWPLSYTRVEWRTRGSNPSRRSCKDRLRAGAFPAPPPGLEPGPPG
jgi:hypothetical protein